MRVVVALLLVGRGRALLGPGTRAPTRFAVLRDARELDPERELDAERELASYLDSVSALSASAAPLGEAAKLLRDAIAAPLAFEAAATTDAQPSLDLSGWVSDRVPESEEDGDDASADNAASAVDTTEWGDRARANVASLRAAGLSAAQCVGVALALAQLARVSPERVAANLAFLAAESGGGEPAESGGGEPAEGGGVGMSPRDLATAVVGAPALVAYEHEDLVAGAAFLRTLAGGAVGAGLAVDGPLLSAMVDESLRERRLNALFGSAGAAQSQAAQSTALEQADLVRGVLQRKKPPGL